MNILFLKLYITEDTDSKFYNSQEIGMAKALVEIHPEHRVDIILLSKKVLARKDIQINDKVNLHIIKGIGIGHHGFIRTDLIKEFKPDLVHLLADNMLFAPNVIRFCRTNGIKCHAYIGTLFTDSNNSFKQSLSKALIQRNISEYKKIPVYVKTPAVLDKCKEFGISATLAPVGMSIENTIISEHSQEDIRKQYNLPLDEDLLLFVGRLEEYKHPLDAINLIQIIDDSNHLVIVGKGPLSDALSEAIDKYELKERVTHLESIPNSQMKDLFKACNYYVNFNPDEIYGMAILEAMCHKCPVFAINAPGPNFLIKDGKTGFLCSSIGEMGIKITKYSVLADSNYRNLTNDARDYVLNNLMWKNTVDAFDDWT